MKNMLSIIIQSPSLFARLLNTLSLLEYMGARKILKSQKQITITTKILAHAAEELRHAQVLKRAALTIAPELCSNYSAHSLLCGRAATYYFHSVDYAVQNEFGHHNFQECYLSTTYLIEKRAIQFYTLFDEALIELQQPTIFRGILAEENRHLKDVADSLEFNACTDNKMQRITAKEERAFNTLLQIIQKTINREKHYHRA